MGDVSAGTVPQQEFRDIRIALDRHLGRPNTLPHAGNAATGGSPRPLPYLFDEIDQLRGGLDVHLEVFLSTERMRDAKEAAVRILMSNARHLYWTPAQMIAHHTVNGCNLQPGDLIGTGTISGPAPAELSSMLEFTAAGTKPVELPNGEQRGFLLDGDEIIFKGRCRREGYASIGFGSCVGRIEAAESAAA